MSDSEQDLFGSPSHSPEEPISPKTRKSSLDGGSDDAIENAALLSRQANNKSSPESDNVSYGSQIPGLGNCEDGEISPRTTSPSFRAINGGSVPETVNGQSSVGHRDEEGEEDEGNGEEIDDGGTEPVRYAEDVENDSLEPEIRENVVVGQAQDGETVETGFDDVESLSPSLPPRSLRELLPDDAEILGEESEYSDDEILSGPSTHEKGKRRSGSESAPGPSGQANAEDAGAKTDGIVDNHGPNGISEDGRATIDPDPEVEILVVTNDEERAEDARLARSETQALEGYPTAPQSISNWTPVVSPAGTNSSTAVATVMIFPATVLSRTPVGASSPAVTTLIGAPALPSDTRANASPSDPISEGIPAPAPAPEPQVHVVIPVEKPDNEAPRPITGLERQVQKAGSPRTFTIVRLIENTDKTGNNIRSAIKLRQHYFDVDFGDFLLDLSGARAEIAQVRNYAGQERYIPRRMLQDVYQPWDIPAKTKIITDADKGVTLPLAFVRENVTAEEVGGNVAFESEEPVMIMDELDGETLQRVTVTDYERKAGSFTMERLERKSVKPWDILVDEEALRAAWGKKAAPKLPKGKEAGKGMKRKRSEDVDDDDDSEAGTDDDDDDNRGEGARKKAKGNKAKAKAKAALKKGKKDDIVLDDKKASDSGKTKVVKQTIKNPSGRRATIDSTMEDNFGDGEESPVVTTKGKRSAGKTIAKKGGKQTRKSSVAQKTKKAKAAALLKEADEETEQALHIGLVEGPKV